MPAKVLAPINFITGTLGGGKSYLAMRHLFNYLVAGKVVATNFDLTGEWWKTVYEFRHGGLISKMQKFNNPETMEDARARFEEYQEIRQLAYRFDLQDDLYDFRPPGKGEDRGLLVMDEQALQMNSRNWEARKKRDEAAHGSTMKSLAFYINMRKMGWTSLVLSHSHEQLDSQLRHMGGAVIRCRNLAMVNWPFSGLLPGGPYPIRSKPLFVAIYTWPETKPVHIYKREAKGLDMRIARHYNSMEEFEENPERLGLRHMAKPYQKVAWYPPQPKFTWDDKPRKLWPERYARARLGGDRDQEQPEPLTYSGSPGSWRGTSPRTTAARTAAPTEEVTTTEGEDRTVERAEGASAPEHVKPGLV